jgi:hypothetical protein
MAVQLAVGEKGVDLTKIQPGVTRANAETLLGPAVKEWVSPTGIRYATYNFDAGRPPRIVQAVLFLTGGPMPELVYLVRYFSGTINDAPFFERIMDRIVIAFDDRDVVLGLFNEFDPLPPDGRSVPRR